MKFHAFVKLCSLLTVLRWDVVVAAVENVEISADGSIQEAAVVEAAAEEVETPPEKPIIDPKCPDRDHIIRCAGAYLDTNKNNKLDRSELQAAIDSLPWYAQGVLKILGSVDKMMKKCDVDKDDAISMDYDMSNNKEDCLATCFKRRAFKSSFFPECDL
ncbi:hypothetical protein FisN_8Lu179 [Fistulifera solaris]|uniref:Uncharacterized protein n=1 Tax=Fistulifera solaris TaxID=1519565 RepID=A0A1Z5JDI1_FISSO|nr:hypothetical protein FisN_8Lu179 [Fistulifera solaris]|eukprot:GAX12055.1 hypothetical protein FisN_8Lu179 [Fistulifera solaris]